MPASIWLQPSGDDETMLQALIAALAAEHGTVPFAPHLTVCAIADPSPKRIEAAADFIATGGSLPIRVRRVKISHSTAAPTRAITIAVENTPLLHEYREKLRVLTGAGALAEPHISLLYTVDSRPQRVSWSGDEVRLRAIAADCETRLAASEFLLDRPILVSPDGDWINVASWSIVRQF